MANVRLFGETSGFVQLAAPDAAGNNTITLPTTGTELVAADATGNITIDGTATFAVGASGTPAIAASGDANTGIYFPAADTIGFAEGGNEAARLDSSGRLLVGETSSTQAGSIDAKAQIVSTDFNAALTVRRNQTGDGAPGMLFCKSRGTSNSANVVVSNGDGLGNIRFFGADSTGGNDFAEGGAISCVVDGTPGSNDMPSRLEFKTTADGASSPTERMRITNSGNVGIDATSPETTLQIGDGSSGNGVPKLRLHRGSGSDYFELDCLSGAPRLQAVGGGDMKFFTSSTERMRISANGEQQQFGTLATNINIANTAGAGTTYEFLYCQHSSTGLANGTLSFRVTTNGNVENTNNSYGAISDIKLKENIVDANSQWDDLKAVQVRNYNFKEETGNPTNTQIGVIAQELELVSPGLVYESPDRETVEIPVLDENGNPVFDENGDPTFTTEERETGEVTKSVNYSVLYMKAVKALQEAMERIETLEQRLSDAGIA